MTLTDDPIAGLPIAFDLDGTLVDTAPDLVRALNASVKPCGLSEVQVDDVRAMVGRGARALIERAFARQNVEAGQLEIDDCLTRFLEVYRDQIAADSRPFANVEAVLDRLAMRGARLSVCTNKPQTLAQALLDQLKMSDRFERIVGAGSGIAKKPDPAHLFAAFGGTPALGVLVGDSEPDALAARAAGAICLLFEGGYSEKPVRTLGADRLFKQYDEFETVLTEAVSARLSAKA